MPSFSFSINKKKETNNKKHGYIIIEKDACGVVFITPQADYYVMYNNLKYNIKPECYTCKGYTNVFRQGETKNKVPTVYIRHKDYSHRVSSLYWLPFAPGVIVRGNIVKSMSDNKIYFSIKSSEIDYENRLAKVALEGYKYHHKEIIEIQRKKMFDGCF